MRAAALIDVVIAALRGKRPPDDVDGGDRQPSRPPRRTFDPLLN